MFYSRPFIFSVISSNAIGSCNAIGLWGSWLASLLVTFVADWQLLIGWLCTVVYTSEAVIKITGWGMAAYFRHRRNILDWLLCLTTVTLSIADSTPPSVSQHGLFSFIRIAKLILMLIRLFNSGSAHTSATRKIMLALITSLPGLVNTGGLLLLLLLVYAPALAAAIYSPSPGCCYSLVVMLVLVLVVLLVVVLLLRRLAR